ALLSRVVTRDIRKLKPGRVTYTCFCDDAGKVRDDGTVTCLEPGHYRVTAAEPTYRWLLECGRRFAADVSDVSESLAALALQGPNARAILADTCDADLGKLKFFRHTRARLAGVPVDLTRT